MFVNSVDSTRCKIPRSYFRVGFSHPGPLALLLRKLDFNKIIVFNSYTYDLSVLLIHNIQAINATVSYASDACVMR